MKPLNLIVIALLLILVGLSGLAYTKYRSAHSGPSYAQVVAERQAALLSLQAQRDVNASNTTAIDNLKADKATICAQVKAAKLTQPLCN